jgi:hypothetical protein
LRLVAGGHLGKGNGMFWRRRRRLAPVRRRLPGPEALETRLPLTASFMISEFLADNHDGLVDRYRNASDWIEIHNQGDAAGSLNGYYLTDKANNKTKWLFPDVTVAARGYWYYLPIRTTTTATQRRNCTPAFRAIKMANIWA